MAKPLENEYPPDLVQSSGGENQNLFTSEKLVNSHYNLQTTEVAVELEQEVWQLTDKEALTTWGVVNQLAYCACLKVGVIVKRGTERVWDVSKIGRLFQPELTVSVSITGACSYLKKWWEGLTYYSQDAVRRIRRHLCEKFRIFTQEDRDWSDPKVRTRAPNPCGDLDMVRLLLLAYLLEKRLLAVGYKLEACKLEPSPNGTGDITPIEVRDDSRSLPQHKGWTLVNLFNLCFKGIAQWGACKFADQTPIPAVVEAIERTWGNLAEPSSMLVEPKPPEPKEPTVSREEWEAAGHGHDPEELAAMLPQKPKRKESLTIPKFAWDQTEEALAWWREQLGKFRWLTKILPDWAMDALVPF